MFINAFPSAGGRYVYILQLAVIIAFPWNIISRTLGDDVPGGFSLGGIPRIDTAKEVTARAGSNLTLRCVGDRPMSWTFPTNQNQNINIRERIIIEEHDVVGGYAGQLINVLTVRDAEYTDTGYFKCMYENTTTGTDSAASVYVYAFDDIEEHLFIPDESQGLMMIVLTKGRPGVIPCRTTHPNTNVRLLKGFQKEAVTVGQDVTYDPKEGFCIDFPNIFYDDMFYCEASGLNMTQELLLIVKYQSHAETPQPELEATHTRILEGEEMQFRCIVRVEKGVVIHMEWSYSSNEHSDRIREKRPSKRTVEANGYIYDEIESTLTVRDVRKSDEGVYRCKAANHQGEFNFREASVYVYDKTFVHLRLSEAVVEASIDAQQVTLSAMIDAYPQPRLIWYHHDVPIPVGDRHYDIRARDDRAKLIIYEIRREDGGLYTLKAFSRDMNTSTSITLLVNEPPTIEMIWPETSPYFMANKYYTLTCKATVGYPAPAVYWNWQKCFSSTCIPNEFAWTRVEKSRNIPQKNRQGFQTTLTLQAIESGFYQCVAENKEGTVRTEREFYVTDVKGGFGMPFHRLYPVKEDNFSIECRANTLTFKPPKLYWGKDNQDILLDNNTDRTIRNWRNNYSHVVSMDIKAIDFQYSGPYYCRTTDLKGNDKEDTLELHVTTIDEPRFTKPLPGGSVFVEPTISHVLICDAVGRPTPIITWYRNKNLLDEADNIKFNHNKTRITFRRILTNNSGLYTCKATNRGGFVVSNMTLNVQAVPPTSGGLNREEPLVMGSTIGLIVGIIAGFIFLVVIVVLITRKCRKPKYIAIEEYLSSSPNAKYNPEIPIDEQTECVPYDPKWEIPRENIRFDIMLGSGAFGKVMRATISGPIGDDLTDNKVAVKMSKDATDREQVKALLSELKVLIHVGQHLNIVNLIGAVTKDINKGLLYVVMEYCKYGSLRNYLLKKRPNFIDTMDESCKDRALCKMQEAQSELSAVTVYMNEPAPNESASYIKDDTLLTTKDLFCYAFQIARGMQYLSSRKYIHRDLAARNILLTEDNVVKISDFGLAKDCYQYGNLYKKKSSGPVPIKWMALESLTHREYSSRSDVWSYGVLLWEIFTVGGNPYPAVELDETFIKKLKEGYRMEKPTYASEDVYRCMKNCWNSAPEQRPGFTTLVEEFGNMLQESVKQHYIELGLQYKLAKGENGYLEMENNTDYLPMSAANSQNPRSASGKQEESDHEYNEEFASSSDPNKKQTPLKLSTRNPVVNETAKDANDDAENVPSQNNAPLETTALVHTSKDHLAQKSQKICTEAPEHVQANEPFLPCRPLNRAVPARFNKGCKSNESVQSDASSGFQSDYITDDSAPPEYNLVMQSRDSKV